MLLTLLTWHLSLTAALLAVYVLVVVAQWSAARVRVVLAGARPAPLPVPVARREGEAGLPAVGTAA